MGMFGSRRLWGLLCAGMIGGAIGVIVALIVSFNFVINVGVPGGYEAGIADVFRYSPVAGVVDALILVGGPVLGLWIGLRIHRKATR